MPFPSEDEQDSVEAWERAYRSSLAQLEHQRLRTMNGTLLQQFGANKWRVENFALENAITRVEGEGEEVKGVVEDVNRRRKADQEKAGETLNRLEKRWTELVSGTLQLEIGCGVLCVQSLSSRVRCTDDFVLQRGGARRLAGAARRVAAEARGVRAVDDVHLSVTLAVALKRYVSARVGVQCWTCEPF
jgi:hypothetical protein